MDKVKILFICLGNICRSPAANAIMQKLIDDGQLAERFFVDSAGIGGWHVGELPDKRMRKHGAARGYRIDHVARQFDAQADFAGFDYIVVMDEENYKNVSRQARNAAEREKIVRMADLFVCHQGCDCVPDPYYDGDEGFELALDLIEDGCQALLARLTGR